MSKKPKLGKNPNVDTSMLFDADRQAEVERKKQELARVWKEEQDAIKAQKVEVTYSYHDPSGRDGLKGHRNTVAVPKASAGAKLESRAADWTTDAASAASRVGAQGFTIEQFLNKCREQVPQLRSCAADQLIYVKEDLIMPHSVTFYELITTKARGKSGPLFQCAAARLGPPEPRSLLHRHLHLHGHARRRRFDVHDDVRTVVDTRVEKDESHPGKVMFRNVYDRNKDKFPYVRRRVSRAGGRARRFWRGLDHVCLSPPVSRASRCTTRTRSGTRTLCTAPRRTARAMRLR